MWVARSTYKVPGIQAGKQCRCTRRVSIMTFLSEHTDEIIALVVVLTSITVTGYQAIAEKDITMPTEPIMLVLGYYYGKKQLDR